MTQASSLPSDEILASILTRLRSAESEMRLAGLLDAGRLSRLSRQLIAELEQIALQDPDPALREGALSALKSPAARDGYARSDVPLSYPVRIDLLVQIDRWLVAGKLRADQAAVLRLRYNYDIPPVAISASGKRELPAQVQSWLAQGLIDAGQAALVLETTPPPAAQAPLPSVQDAPAAAAAAVAVAPAARPPKTDLLNVLFSETSIHIALYLGGFLIVAAALILAAVIEIARLPILLGLSAAAALAAGLLRRRLPLPSFVLFLIFASLLPIDARIWADTLRLSSTDYGVFWGAAWLAVALVLGLGVRIYTSRWLSVFALAALDCAAALFVYASPPEFAPAANGQFLLLAMLAALAGLGGVILLQRWQEPRFARPTFWFALAQAALLVGLGYFELLNRASAFAEFPAAQGNLALVFLLAAGSSFAAHRLVSPAAWFPWLAALGLLLAPFALALPFTHADPTRALLFFATGLICIALGEGLDWKSGPGPRRFALPLLVSALLQLAYSGILLPFGEHPVLALALLTGPALVLSLLHARRKRAWLWLAALLFACGAYLMLFQLPLLRAWQVNQRVQVLTLGLLLALPDLWRGPGRAAGQTWTVLPRWLGALALALLALANAGEALSRSLMVLYSQGPPATRVPWNLLFAAASASGLTGLAYALRFHTPRLSYLFAAGCGLALIYLLNLLDQTSWMAALAALGIAFALVGYTLRARRLAERWSVTLRNAGLALAALVILRLPFEPGALPGLALLAGGGLFLAEMLLSRRAWLEFFMHGLLCAGAARLVQVAAGTFPPTGAALLCASLIVLGFDLFFTRRALQPNGTPLQRGLVRAAGLALALGNTAYLLSNRALPAGHVLAIAFAYAAFAALAAWAYRAPRVFFFTSAYLALGLFYTLRAAGQTRWVAPLVGLALAYYLLSIPIQRRRPAWGAMLRLSGLALAMLVSLSAPLEGGLISSIPVAAAATLYAVEAFRRRNVWIGFPANGLYLLAYFILLFELKVDQPQYYSVGVALLGMLMHFLLVRSGSKLGAFLTGMVSQLALLGTTYIQMLSTNQLSYFIILFFQGLAVLGYGILIRSRSLVLAPLVFIVLGVTTVVLSILSGVPTAIIIGCTGVALLTAGILAVLLRERLVSAGKRLGGWRA